MSRINSRAADQCITLNVNPNNILRDVEEGKYNSRPKFLVSKQPNSRLRSKPAIPTDVEQAVPDVLLDNNQEDRYTRVTSTGNKIELVTSEVAATQNKIVSGECLYCRLRHDSLELGLCYDITTDLETGEEFYYVKNRRICSPACLISYLGYIHIPPRERAMIEAYTLSMLRSICGQDYVPEGADDFDLLEKNGGGLSYEGWSDDRVSYDPSQTRTVRIVPTKAEYVVHRKL